MGSHASVSGSRPGDVVEVRCIEREREALLEFKQGLIDEGGLLSSWGDVDHQKECCEWHGVVCSETTRHVIGLNLPFGELHGNVSRALLELQHLNHLDLSYNDFDGKEIPGFIASFPELEHLYLAYCGFSGIIPHQLGNMTNLRTLDLSWNRLEGLMPELRLIALRELHLSHNFLQGVVSEAHFSNLHSLKLLHLSYNSLVFNFSTTTNNWVPPFQLDVMDVASCYMGPHFPEWVQTQSNISHLGLAGAGISGQVPEWLWDLSPRLQYLNISHNPDKWQGSRFVIKVLAFSHNRY
ncbi:Receptor-like protein EIX1 [Sesamum angolense]|uniref:Receptor-like protein EIX1 n=1 Tax=Sesamum angolense TaxID=2727404 RepID=A0AAE1WD40_9LAMI|nr:Receptor-like protein EIX1 [Sesamum angolense]